MKTKFQHPSTETESYASANFQTVECQRGRSGCVKRGLLEGRDIVFTYNPLASECFKSDIKPTASTPTLTSTQNATNALTRLIDLCKVR